MQVQWGYVISTLIFRFAAIFVVLGSLVILMQINGAIVSRVEKWRERRRSPVSPAPAAPDAAGPTPAAEASSDEPAPATLAAIGLALSLSASRQVRVASATAHGDGSTSWQMAGRLRQFDSRSPR